jgi:hypothetical protein
VSKLKTIISLLLALLLTAALVACKNEKQAAAPAPVDQAVAAAPAQEGQTVTQEEQAAAKEEQAAAKEEQAAAKEEQAAAKEPAPAEQK